MTEKILDFILDNIAHTSTDFAIVLIFVCWVMFVYKRDIKDRSDKAENIETMLNTHVADELVLFENLGKSIDSLSKAINDINLKLVRNHITKSDLYQTEWKTIVQRIDETAEVLYNGAITDAEKGEKPHEIQIRFVASAAQRVKESFRIWAEQGVSYEMLETIKTVDKLCQPTGLAYLAEAVSTLENGQLLKGEKLSIFRQKIYLYIEKIKSLWHDSLIERVNFKND